MKKSERRQQLLRAVQEYMTQEGLTPSDVYRRVLDHGGGVSDSTIRRIAKADWQTENFSLDVLQRLTDVLFGITDKPKTAAEIDTPAEAEREALKAVTALTDVALREAQSRIAELEKLLADSTAKIEQLAELAAFRKSQMLEKDKQIERLWRMLGNDLQSL